ncbi:hypothetical protein PCASD_09331 [Puccinia coronata f. sp. avenae]|uniref:Uncharacterized protein n=1 Tax=Puccinia coronata f. sp. avenae TaxID=200324 RepID=A0A2N5S5G0_9BASI|nr:hypothetical protein PCASD_22332 [Puccinia coronata f. sp. avenae]PLW40730.1 hypothetical protein PCASD_09331 [Puccinia coronata f. sp. avenae]
MPISESEQENSDASNQSNVSSLRRSQRVAPKKQRPGMVVPSADSRQLLNASQISMLSKSRKQQSSSQIPTSSIPPPSGQSSQSRNSPPANAKKRKPSKAGSNSRSKRGNTTSGDDQDSQDKRATSANHTGTEIDAHDFNQDSNDEIQEISAQVGRQTKKAEADEYDKVQEFFDPPFWKDGDTKGSKINYRCKWCQNTYQAHGSSFGNLKTHQDGSTQVDKNARGCPSCAQAIKAGATLPPSVAEKRSSAIDPKQRSITAWTEKKNKLKKTILNQLIVVWQIRHALPWTRIEDEYLRAAFVYANPEATLFGRKWLAQQAKSLYLLLKQNVFSDLKKTDSGSNNNTMAQEMALIFNQESNKTMGIPNEWDPSAMHVRCACHKLALLVNASLKALSIITAPKRSVLGFFPVLDWTIEEHEEDKSPGSNTNKVNHKGNTDSTEINEVEEDEGEETEYSDEGDTDDDEDGRNESNSDSDDECAAGDTALQLECATGGLASNAAIPNAPDSLASGALRLRDLTEKLDKVIKIIT